MSETVTKPRYRNLAELAGLPPSHRLVRLAEREHKRLMRSLGGTASERELWLIEQCVLRLVEREAASELPVTDTHRYKRPPWKQQAAPLAGPTVVTKRTRPPR